MTIYDKILAVYAKIRAAINNKPGRDDIAYEFSSGAGYSHGDLVYYENSLYMCVEDHHSGEWDADHFIRADVNDAINERASLQDLEGRARKIDIAANFSVAVRYEVGDLVYYNGVLYRCIAVHTGAWDSNHFALANVDDVLKTKASASDLAAKAGKSDIAPAFSSSVAYYSGDLVYKDGVLYRCVAEHAAGAWDNAHFAAANVDDVLKTKITASDVADNASRSDIAPEFSTTTEYIAGELVYKEGALYKCIRGHEAGSWDAGDFSAADVNDALMYDSRAGVVDTTLYPGENYVELSSGTITQIDASQLTSLTVTPAIPPETVPVQFKVTDMLLRVDTGANGCVISHGWSGPCICSNPNWNILPANSINILTYTYAGQVSSTDPDPVFLVGVVSSQIDTSSSS